MAQSGLTATGSLDWADDVPGRSLQKRLADDRSRLALWAKGQLDAYDARRSCPRPEDSAFINREQYEFHVRGKALAELHEVITEHCRASDTREPAGMGASLRRVVLVALMAAHVATDARARRLVHSLQSVARQVAHGGGGLLAVVSWYASTPGLVARVRAAFEEAGFCDSQSLEDPAAAAAAAGPTLIAVRCLERQTQFQHLQRGFRAAGEVLRKRRAAGPPAVGGGAAWVAFADDDDLWHSHRTFELVEAIQSHPRLESVGIFATTTRANIIGQCNMPEEELPTTEAEVDLLLARGTAWRMDEEAPSRAWHEELGRAMEATGSTALLPIREDVGLEYFDLCPRWRIVEEFFEGTSPTVLAHRYCDLRFLQFLLTYPRMGRETGLQVQFFIPDPSCWMYFYSCVGMDTKLWAKSIDDEGAGYGYIGTDDGHVSSRVAVEIAEKRFAADRLHLFKAIDSSLTLERLVRCLAAFRNHMELWLVRRHTCTVDQATFDAQVFLSVSTGFGSLLAAVPTARSQRRACRICQDFARTLAEHFCVSVVWQDADVFIMPDITVHVQTHDLASISSKLPSEEMLSRWQQHEAVNSFLRSFALENAWGEAPGLRPREVFQLLSELGIRQEEMVAAFAELTGEREVEAVLSSLLQNFMSCKGEISLLPFRDVYCLLELLGISLPSLVLTMRLGDRGSAQCCEQEELGSYRILRVLGRGMGGCEVGGSVVYLAEHAATLARVALKWPVEDAEVSAMEALALRAPSNCTCGLPRLHTSGVHKGTRYFVTDLLGSELPRVLQRFAGQPLRQRWHLARVVGRLVLRRLEVLHSCGYVHGDVALHNVLLGRSASGQVVPYLVDFGCARRYPGGGAVPGYVGSLEFSSIRSGEGGERRPEDDLEALGWSLVSVVFGPLPWFDWLAELYKVSGNDPTRLAQSACMVERVQGAKARLLCEGWGSAGLGWEHLQQVPPQLDAYLRACQPSPGSECPDYGLLAQLLGAGARPPGPRPAAAEEEEEEDAAQFWELLAPALHRLPRPVAEQQQPSRGGELVPGQAVHVWSVSKERWAFDGVVQEVDGFWLPAGSVKVTYDAGRGLKWILPQERRYLLRRADEESDEEDADGQQWWHEEEDEEDLACAHEQEEQQQEELQGLLPCALCGAWVCRGHPAICPDCVQSWEDEQEEASSLGRDGDDEPGAVGGGMDFDCGLKKGFLTGQPEHSKHSVSDFIQEVAASDFKQDPSQVRLLRPGDVVEAFGLESERGQWLNGQRGVIIRCLDERGRVEVQFEPDTRLNLKTSNLQPLQPAPDEMMDWDDDVHLGCLVEIVGLSSPAGQSLNGQRGAAVDYNSDKSRFKVRLACGSVVSVKRENLRVLMHGDPPRDDDVPLAES